MPLYGAVVHAVAITGHGWCGCLRFWPTCDDTRDMPLYGAVVHVETSWQATGHGWTVPRYGLRMACVRGLRAGLEAGICLWITKAREPAIGCFMHALLNAHMDC